MIVLNLLTPERRASLAAQRQLRWTRRLCVTVVLAIGITSGLVRGAAMLLEQRTTETTAQVTLLQQRLDRDDLKALAATVTGINDRTQVLNTLAEQDLAWGAFIADLLRSVPNGIRLTSLTVDRTSRAIEFGGTAATRNDLLHFQSVITAAGFLDQFDTPLTDLSQPTNIAFPNVSAHVPSETIARYLHTP